MRIHPRAMSLSVGATHSLLAAGALALLTWAGLQLNADVASAALLYLAVVVAVSLRGRLLPAVLAAAGAVALLDYYFTPPRFEIAVQQPLDIVAFVVFSATAVVITRLITALRASETRWRDVFDNNPTMYFIVDPAGTVLSVNPFGAAQLGYDVNDLVGKSVLTVFAESDRDAARGHLASSLANVGQSISWEICKTHRDGHRMWVRETARAVDRGGERPIVLIACEDITDRKLARDQLWQSEARMREQASLLDLTHDAIFVRGMDSRIGYWNQGAEELYGWTREEAVGRISHELLHTVFPEPTESIETKLVRSGRWEGELVHTARDGTKVLVASRWSAQRNENGEVIGALETNTDISAQRRAEDSFRQSQADLMRAANLSTMGEFAASIAHELRQPLAAVVMNGSAALRWIDRKTPELDEAREAIARTVSEAQRADDVIRSLRGLVGKSSGERTPLRLNELVDQVLALVRSEAQRHQVALQTDLSPDLPATSGDRVQLQQVLLNLIVNGIEALAAGTDDSKVLIVRTERVDAERVAVVVEDNGPGLDAGTADAIFQPFFTTKPNGLGMGLSICRSIIDEHGGELHVAPRVPKGTVFRFVIPTHESVARESPTLATAGTLTPAR